ncbi:MAG TPA: class I SAM-dependent methyltransferase [Gallionellaceae bacterium]|nr:class I SAM-dependent methyltransferase [Gallionellaceae bacterium]
MSDKKHWDAIYKARQPGQVSWFQAHAVLSLQFIRDSAVAMDANILDVGAGASVLVDDLLNAGYRKLSVLDISAVALHAAQQRLGPEASRVKWIEADVTQLELPEASVDVWHDRAVFHFLTDPLDRQRYVQAVLRTVKPGGHVIIATFAEDGPLKCSGLDIVRYRPDTLHQEFGNAFEFVKSAKELHCTPSGADQSFVYCYFRR